MRLISLTEDRCLEGGHVDDPLVGSTVLVERFLWLSVMDDHVCDQLVELDLSYQAILLWRTTGQCDKVGVYNVWHMLLSID